jgi:hypothetical protein
MPDVGEVTIGRATRAIRRVSAAWDAAPTHD